MNFTQNEKLKQLSVRSIIIGVDIASELHYARAFDWRGVELGNVFKFANNAEGFKDFNAWIERLKRQAQKDCIVVGAEPTGHYWFGLASYLKEQSIKLVLVNPFHVKRSKELDDNHPSKTDAKDPKTIAKLVIEGRYNEPYIPEGIYAELRIAMACRMRIQKELNSIKNRIQRWLKIYFPEHETDLYCSYTFDQILVALGKHTEQKKSAFREGVLYLAEKKLDVFFVTLNKSEKDYSPSTMYQDYSINEELFHWQSQSRTTVESLTGQRYLNQPVNGGKVLFFVREYIENLAGAKPLARRPPSCPYA